MSVKYYFPCHLLLSLVYSYMYKHLLIYVAKIVKKYNIIHYD